jgi:hypothetical protein
VGQGAIQSQRRMLVVRRNHQIERRGKPRADVFDLSCANAQRLFSKDKKSERREARPPPLLNNFNDFPSFRVAAITLSGWHLRLRMLFGIVSDRATDVYDFLELALLVASHKTFVFAGIN